MNDYELAPVPAGDVSGKVWSTLNTTQQAGVYPKSSLGFATYHVSSAHYAMRVQPVRHYIGTLRPKC